jgi:hypothetical protein
MKSLWEEPVQSVPVDEAMLRSAEQNALPWKVSSAEQNDPMRWKAYSLGFALSEDLPPTPNPSGYDRILGYIDGEIKKAAAEGRDFMSSTFLNQLFPSVSPPPPTRLERVRSWLGWKLWRLAARLEPDVAD